MKRILIAYLILIFIPLYSCSLHYDLALWNFMRSDYKKMSHPENTQQVLRKGQIYSTRNGNYCDTFRIFEIRKYDPKNKAEIVNFYKDKIFETKDAQGNKGNAHISFYFSEDIEKIDWIDKERNWFTQAKIKTQEPIYILIVSSYYGNFPFDYRCT